jgi:hypothetical protein
MFEGSVERSTCGVVDLRALKNSEEEIREKLLWQRN